MYIGNFEEYRGYIGSINYDPEDNVYYGKLLNIMDVISYQGNDITELERDYCETVDWYIDLIRSCSE